MSLIECPSGFAFKARKLSGRIMAQVAAQEVDDLSTLVAQCCTEVVDPGPYALGDKDRQPNWKRVLTGDLTVAFTRLRAISMPPSHDGEVFKWRVRCQNELCLDDKGKRTEFFWTVRLCDVPLVKLSEEAFGLVKRGNDAFPGTLLDNRPFTFKLPSDEDGAVIRKLLRDSGIQLRALESEEASRVLLPFTIAARITSIEGVHRDKVHSEALDLDPWSHGDMREQISKQDCGYDSFQGKCHVCGTLVDLNLPFLPRLLLSLESTERRERNIPSAEPVASSTPTSPG